MYCTITLTQTCNFPWIHSAPQPDKNCAMPHKWEECNMTPLYRGSSCSEAAKDNDSDYPCYPQAWHHDWEQNYLHSATVELLTNSNKYIRLYKQQTSIYTHNRNSTSRKTQKIITNLLIKHHFEVHTPTWFINTAIYCHSHSTHSVLCWPVHSEHAPCYIYILQLHASYTIFIL
jgi:hypothetical protein